MSSPASQDTAKDAVKPNGGQAFDEVWRPKSSLPRWQAEFLANKVASLIPGARYYPIQETHSMEPILWGNCFIIVETKVKIGDIKRGDILVYRHPLTKILTLHTCIGNHGGRLTMKGYNNFDTDNHENVFITETDVVGRYVGHIVFDPNQP